jgi:hypothetical protein
MVCSCKGSSAHITEGKMRKEKGNKKGKGKKRKGKKKDKKENRGKGNKLFVFL